MHTRISAIAMYTTSGICILLDFDPETQFKEWPSLADSISSSILFSLKIRNLILLFGVFTALLVFFSAS